MAITLEQAMEHLNADDDEKEKVELALKHAQTLVDVEIKGNDYGFKFSDPKLEQQREDIIDRNILQVMANNYLHPDGATKTVFNNMSSQDSIANYMRVPSV